ncbi:SRPBCC domain-containing protein [Streptomyces sp. NPDC059894]|uniref:SRPBCC domain-containing protein n=1 Tax=unclassified Streptomyces TaxID=2593676 RepID=UPI00365ED8CF
MVIDLPSDEPSGAAPQRPDSVHGSFEVTLVVPAAPERVFAAYAEPELRRRWFRIPGAPGQARHELDFRVGGRETASGTLVQRGVPETIEYRSEFLDIVPLRRIVLACSVSVGAERSASLVTVELSSGPGGTRLRHTEQFVLLTGDGDGSRAAHLRGGVRLQLNGLIAAVREENPAFPKWPQNPLFPKWPENPAVPKWPENPERPTAAGP